MTTPVVLALVGPTATGKTAIACALAPALDAEIVCVDSMTVYRGMDVGTAKPSAAERAAVPHHLLDVADPVEPFNVSRFQSLAREVVRDLRARGRVPFVVGGSGLYFRAVVDDLDFPPTDPAVRARLDAEETAMLAGRLARLDPDATTFLNLENRRRVIRALEVIELTGRPFSSFRDQWDRYRPLAVAGLSVGSSTMTLRARARLEAMLDAGFLDEVRALLDRGWRDALTSSRAIAYREAIKHLEGEITREEMIERAAVATRQLARRQAAWFRRDPRVHWIDAEDAGRATSEVGAYYRRCLEGDPSWSS